MLMLKNYKVPIQDVDARRHTRHPESMGVLRGFLTPETSDNPEQVAWRFLSSNEIELGNIFTKGPMLESSTGSGNLIPDSRIKSPAGYHVRFKQWESGVPVVGAGASVHMNRKRQVYLAINDLTDKVQPFDVQTELWVGLSKADAVSKAVEALQAHGRLRGKPTATVVIYQHDGRPYLAWQVTFGVKAITPIQNEEDRAASWLVFVDVKSGDVLKAMNILTRASGEGKVFYPNPVVTLRDTHLSMNSQLPPYAYRFVPLEHLGQSGYLNGKYITTRLTPKPRVHDINHQFLFDRQDEGFEEVMAYYWIDQISQHLEDLGFQQILKKAIRVNSRGTQDDNSWYEPGKWTISYGVGGINDAEDADIILHEFGHAFLDALVPGWGDTGYDTPVRAMGEGVADFLACTYLADLGGNFHPEVVGDWDAVAYSSDDPPALRRMDNSKCFTNVIGRGRITALTANRLTDNNAHWIPDGLRGLALTPNVNAIPRPVYFTITDNSKTTITVETSDMGSLTAISNVGDQYSGEEHQDGEFWAGLLWDIYLGLGGSLAEDYERLKAADNALKLVLTAHRYLDDQDRDTITFVDAGDALIDADRSIWAPAIDEGPNKALLKDILKKRKLL